MSTPESSLKKTKRTPLPGGKKRQVPFRAEEIIPPDLTSTDDEQLDCMTRHHIINELRRTTEATSKNNGINNTTDDDLLVTMASRLGQVECELLSARREIIEKDQHIRHLEERLLVLEQCHNSSDDTATLQERCLALKQQVEEMEEFLADYGMIWVGSGSHGNSSNGNHDDSKPNITPTMWNPADSYAESCDADNTINYDLIIANVKELNQLAGEDMSYVSRDKQGASLKVVEPVSLTLYMNGIILFNGPFRPFIDPSTMQCVRDLQDGYFPSELRSRYPDGIPLKLTDMRDTVFKPRQYGDIFPGTGRHLGGKETPSRLLPSTQQAKNGGLYKETSELPGPSVPLNTFLSRLPQCVMKRGKIIDVRSGVQDVLKGDMATNTSNVLLADTPAIQEIKNRLQSADGTSRPSSSSQSYCTLRVTSETGDKTYIVKMRANDTIDDLREQLDKLRVAQGVCRQDYIIHSRFPHKTLTRGGDTLQQSGLCPSANLFLSKCSTSH